MPKGLPLAVKDNLEKCRSAAIAAVEVYNRPGPRFRTAHFTVLIVMSWTALLHAIFYNKGMKPWFKKKGSKPRGDRLLPLIVLSDSFSPNFLTGCSTRKCGVGYITPQAASSLPSFQCRVRQEMSP
jgi:hypothetical protein